MTVHGMLPTATLRGHSAEVQALSFVSAMADGSKCLASGSLDGMIVLWDAVSLLPLFSWRAHAGGVLCLQEGHGRASDAATFVSQGRDGCVHGWTVRFSSASSSADDLSLLDDLLGGDGASGTPAAPRHGPQVQPPQKLWTLKAGFGGFCRMAQLDLAVTNLLRSSLHQLEEAEEPDGQAATDRPAVAWATPALDGMAIDIWLQGGPFDTAPVPVSRLQVPRAAAVSVASSLGRLTGPDGGGHGNSVTDSLSSTGMLMGLEMVRVERVRGLEEEEEDASHVPQAQPAAVASESPDDATGQHPHPEAASLRELLQMGTQQGQGPAMQDARHDRRPSPRPATAEAGLLCVCCYENGGVYVLGKRAHMDMARPIPPDERAGGGLSPQEDNDTTALISLPVCSEPLMSLALSPASPGQGSYLACVSTSAAALYVTQLEVMAGQGQVLHKVTLSTPGASICLRLPALLPPGLADGDGQGRGRGVHVWATGGWDGSLRVLRLAGEGPPSLATHRWQQASMYSLAATGGVVACGCQDGRIYLVGHDQARWTDGHALAVR